MAFPSYIPTRVVSVGGSSGLESGRLLRTVVDVKASRSLIWDDTGARLEATGVAGVSSEGSEVTFELPRTDVLGWKDAKTGSLIDVSIPESYSHRYVATVSFQDESGRRVGASYTLGPFVVTDGVGPIDLDKMVPASTVAGDAVSIPDRWAGLVGDALQAAVDSANAAEAAAAALVDSAAFVDTTAAAKIADPTSATAVAVVGVGDARYASKVGVEAQTLAARRPRFVRPQETVISNFGTGHGWAPTTSGNGGSSGTFTLNDTSQRGRADQVITGVSLGDGALCRIERSVPTPFDPTGKTLVLLVRVDAFTQLNGLSVRLATSSGFSNSTTYTALPNSGNPVDAGEWAEVAFTAGSSSGSGVGTTANFMRIEFRDRATAPVTVSVGGLSYFTPEKFPNGLVSITLDDTKAAHYTTCRTILNKYRFRPTVFPILSFATGNSAEQGILRAYFEDGWDIGAHASTGDMHMNWTTLTPDQLETELQANKQWLVQRGIRSESLAYPGGASNAAVRAAASRYFQYGRSTFGTYEALPPSRPLGLRSVLVLNTTTLAAVKTQVDAAKSRRQWLVLTFHDIVTDPSSDTYAWGAADFEALVDYIAAQGVACLSLADAGVAMSA